MFYILLFFPLMVAFWAVRALRTFNVRFYVFKNGFIYARGRKYRVVRWDQVVAVFQKHTAGRYSSSPPIQCECRRDVKFRLAMQSIELLILAQ
ncbi:MAG: DUF6585 family protein [Ktedonobacteraceae bacterium]